MPSADQSRCASSISLSDLLIHTARRRPFKPVIEQDARDLAALARAGAVAQKPAASKADGIGSVVARGGRQGQKSHRPSRSPRGKPSVLRRHR